MVVYVGFSPSSHIVVRQGCNGNFSIPSVFGVHCFCALFGDLSEDDVVELRLKRALIMKRYILVDPRLVEISWRTFSRTISTANTYLIINND